MSGINPLDPPHLFLPPLDTAHDVYSLAAQLDGFDSNLYQDIQEDSRIFDTFQRWPYLFDLVMNKEDD